MKILTLAAAGLCLAASLAACASLPDATAVAGAAKPVSDPVVAKARLDTLKEVNRHIELCHRTYTLGFPFTGLVDCKAQGEATAAAPNVADIARAVVDALIAAGVTPKAPTTSP